MELRNIAIIAHVDHGKTTLVDQLIKQSHTLEEREVIPDRAMDSNDIEKERGITITAKNTCINWHNYRINIVDTPGHADFGGEVERVLSMVDSVLLLVDAVDGPMPQTRFVTQKAFANNLNPIVVINKVDREGARPDWVVDEIFDLFDRLGANDEQLDFPIVYASALSGFAMLDLADDKTDMTPLFQTIVDKVAPPKVDPDGSLQLQVSSLDYTSFLGVMGIGRIQRGIIKQGQQVSVIATDESVKKFKIQKLFGFKGLQRIEVNDAQAVDIVVFSGADKLNISDTVCDPDKVEALPSLVVDQPTVSMTFQVNTSPFAGKEGKFLTSRQIKERLDTELLHNVALRVEQTDDPDKFIVSGRGELHLTVLIENMRREGYELGISRPQVIIKEIDGEKQEPYEQLVVDIEEDHQGAVMEKLGFRKAELHNMQPDGHGRVRLDYTVPSRGLIGFRTEFLTATSGTGLLYNTFEKYGPLQQGGIGERSKGVLISNGQGKSVAFALFALQERGKLILGAGEDIYEGMIIGEHSRDNDLTVNPLKGKQLTNMRASGSDESIILTPHLRFTLEQALEFINDDELVEVTPDSIRIRKRYLTENERKRYERNR